MKNINSLKNISQFKEVYENGKSLANKYLVMYYLQAEGDLRLGISVSKKVGNSVVRHRLTRLIRNSFLKNKNYFPEGSRIVIVARNAAKDKNQKDIDSAFEHLMKIHKII